uniref:HEAT repeat-containing protein 1 n=1 Tax=Syphacia muris TaxID=451379 RepID=A0A0N5ANL5_9BILA
MTTTLARQLEHLQVAASAQLGIERSHVSLLFDRKEAASLYKEDVLKIGQSGLSQLRKVDPAVINEDDENELFSETALTLQRILLTAEENKRLDKVIERVLARISPYLLQFATQQILEWLIYRFQIHLFNGPKLFITFLPFHNTKIFARLLSLLQLKGIEYDWVREYAKDEVPIPFEVLVTKCFSKNHSLLSLITSNIDETVAVSISTLCYVKFKCLSFLRLLPLRLCSLTITAQLCVSVSLAESVLHSMLKLILLKISAATMCASIDTVILLCQRQDIKTLPLKYVYVVSRSDLQMDYIVEMVRNTQDQRTLRDCLRLLTAAVKISPVDVLSQMMSVFTFMGSGLLKKDNDLTLGIIEETLSVLFSAIITDNLFNDRLVSVARIFATSVVDIPAHRRMRILHAVADAATAKHLWVVIALLFEQYCVTWQRNVVVKEQFEEMATEMVSLYNGAEQLLCAINLVEYIVFMGDDSMKKSCSVSEFYKLLFDRSKHSVQKLRHYRFAILGWVARLLDSKDLFDKLSDSTDEEIYNNLLVIGKRMLICSMELDEFVTAQSSGNGATGSSLDAGTIKYWMAVTSRADIIAEKFRNLLPISVSSRLVAEILSDQDVNSKLRDKALQLLNVKLMQDGVFYKNGGIEAKHMILFAEKLLTWIKPTEVKIEVLLCQNAAFTMRLLARRMDTESCNEILSKCVEWRSLDEALVGNIFLLLAEIIKSHNMRATLLASNLAVPISSGSQEVETRITRRKRVAQQSLSGRRIGGDTLLVCGLACLQRILDQFAHYVSVHFVLLLTTISRLSARYDPDFEIVFFFCFNCKILLYDTYNTLALPHFGRFFELVPQIMLHMNASKTDTKCLLFFGKKGTFEALEGNSLLTLIIDFVAKCAKHQEFFTDERLHLVLDSIIDELDNSIVFGHEERCYLHLSDCLYNMADTHNDVISDMFAKIMLKTRSTSSKTRYRILLVLERMFSRMGEAVAPILPSVLPFLSELLEDDKKKVEEQWTFSHRQPAFPTAVTEWTGA